MSNLKLLRFSNLKFVNDHTEMFKTEPSRQAIIKRIEKGNVKTNEFIKEELLRNKNKTGYTSGKLASNNVINNKLKTYAEELVTLSKYILDGKNVWFHYKKFNEMLAQNPGTFIQQIVRFFKGERLVKVINITTTNRRNFKDQLKLKLIDGSGGPWRVFRFLNNKPSTRRVEVVTKSYNKLSNLNNQLKFLQTFRDNDTGTCVYDAFIKYFENKKSPKGIKMYKRLLKNSELYKKEYNLDNIKQICELVKSSLSIVDLVNKDDIIINENEYNLFKLKMINTKYNHLELLSNNFENIEVEKDEYETIKKDSNFYIESFNTLYLVDKTYVKKDNDFSQIFKQWKQECNFNRYRLNENSKAYNFILNYDFSTHCFLNNKLKVDNKLYQEMDLKKAYYNYSNKDKNRFYQGVPSGAFICVRCDDKFDFFKLVDKCGFYEIEILEDSNKLNYYGFIKNHKYVLTDPVIKLLYEHNIAFKFLNACYAPTVHIPFNEKFLLNFDDNGMLTEKPDDFNFKGYVKATGLMAVRNDSFNYTIKPLATDANFYSCFCSSENDVYTDGKLIFVKKNNETQFTHYHIYSYIHSYTKCLILEQLFKMDYKDIFGIKVDSIVYKGNYELNENFSNKETNIESMVEDDNLDDGLDYGTDVEVIRPGHYRPFFINCGDDSYQFKKPFLYTGDHIYQNKIFIGGQGGTGKSESLLTNLEPSETVYTTICWNLINSMRGKYGCRGYSIPKILGENMGKKCEMISEDTFNKIKNLVIDEATMISNEILKKLFVKFPHINIFIIGDINKNGQPFQLMIEPDIIKKFDGLQYVEYTVNFRHDKILNDKLLKLRQKMIELYNKKDNIKQIVEYIKSEFKNHFINKEDIIFNDNIIGISTNNELGTCSTNINEYFIDKGTKPRYIYKYTDLKNGYFKGCPVDDKFINDDKFKNKEMNLFKSVHSMQGLTIELGKKLLINMDNVFHFNLLYTALSRCRSLDQILFIDN
jgi:hypothetical protein